MSKTRSGTPPGRAHGTFVQLYSHEELRYRPIEQVLEDLPCRVLAKALGCSKVTAMMLKRDPSVYVGTSNEIDERAVRRIRAFLDAVPA